MKTFTFPLILLFVLLSNLAVAQTGVSDTLVRDSIPILLTDTSSYNFNAKIMISGHPIRSWGQFEDTNTCYTMFYEKRVDSLSYSSIWCKELRTLSDETIFISSNDSLKVTNPQATHSHVVFYEEETDSITKVKALLINPSTLAHLDSLEIFSSQTLDKFVANHTYILWIIDSVLYKQNYYVESNSIILGNIDTINNNVIDVCVNDITSGFYYFESYFTYLTSVNSVNYIYTSMSGSPFDQGNISDIHYNYNKILFYKKGNEIYSAHEWWMNTNHIALFNNTDTLVPNYLVADEEYAAVKDRSWGNKYAYTTDSFPNTFNLIASYGNLVAFDTFVYNPTGQYYAYPFPTEDTIKNIIMQVGYVLDSWSQYWVCFAENIIIEVGHDNRNALYLVRSSISGGGSGISELETFEIKIFPNPTNSLFQIQTSSDKINRIEIYDIQGRQVQRILNVQNRYEHTIDVSGLRTGIYFIKASSENNVAVEKFIKQ